MLSASAGHQSGRHRLRRRDRLAIESDRGVGRDESDNHVAHRRGRGMPSKLPGASRMQGDAPAVFGQRAVCPAGDFLGRVRAELERIPAAGEIRRLLSCDRDEICERLRPVILAAKAKGIAVNYEELFADLSSRASARQ